MLDSALQTLIQSTLIAGLAARGVTAGVKQINQPRQFVMPSTPTIFHTMAPRKLYGWPSRRDVVNSDKTLSTITTQVVHTRFQIAGLVPNASPVNPNGLTSADLANIAAAIMQHENALTQYVAADCNIFRIGEIANLPFQDSSAQNVWWSAFDIIFTHKDEFATSTGAISVFKPNVNSVT